MEWWLVAYVLVLAYALVMARYGVKIMQCEGSILQCSADIAEESMRCVLKEQQLFIETALRFLDKKTTLSEYVTSAWLRGRNMISCF